MTDPDPDVVPEELWGDRPDLEAYTDSIDDDDPLWQLIIDIMSKPVEDPDKPAKVVP